MSNYSLDPMFFKRIKIKVKHLWPEKLPVTREEIDVLIKDVIFSENVPDDPTYHHAIAAALMHLGPVTHRKARRFFSKSVRKSIANQVAFEKIQALRDEAKALEEHIKHEATFPEGPQDGPESQEASGQVVS